MRLSLPADAPCLHGEMVRVRVRLGRVCRVAGISEKFDQAKLGSRGFGILDVACAPGATSCRALPAWGDGYVGLWLDGVRVAGASEKFDQAKLGSRGFGILDVAVRARRRRRPRRACMGARAARLRHSRPLRSERPPHHAQSEKETINFMLFWPVGGGLDIECLAGVHASGPCKEGRASAAAGSSRTASWASRRAAAARW